MATRLPDQGFVSANPNLTMEPPSSADEVNAELPAAVRLLRAGRFHLMDLFLDQYSHNPAGITSYLQELAAEAEYVDATPAMREYLLDSSVAGYDWSDFRFVAPRPYETILLWGKAPTHVTMPDGEVVARSEFASLPPEWGAVTFTRAVDEIDHFRRNIPRSAAGIVEIFLVMHEPQTDRVLVPVMHAVFPCSSTGRALRFDDPPPDNMVQGRAFLPGLGGHLLAASMMTLLNPLVLALSHRHDQSVGSDEAPQDAPEHDIEKFPLAAAIESGSYQIPARPPSASGPTENDLRRAFRAAMQIAALMDITETVVDQDGNPRPTPGWDQFSGIALPSSWVLVEAKPGDVSPRMREELDYHGVAHAWAGLCQMIPPERVAEDFPLPERTEQVLGVYVAIQDKPNGPIRFPVAMQFVPLDRGGRPLRMVNGYHFMGTLETEDKNLPSVGRQLPLLMSYIAAGLGNGA